MRDGVMMRSGGWLPGPSLLQRADELCRLHRLLHRAVHTAAARARPPRALRHQGGASGCWSQGGSSCPRGPRREEPVHHPHPACSQGPSPLVAGARPQALVHPQPQHSPGEPSPWAGCSPQSRGCGTAACCEWQEFGGHRRTPAHLQLWSLQRQ